MLLRPDQAVPPTPLESSQRSPYLPYLDIAAIFDEVGRENKRRGWKKGRLLKGRIGDFGP